MPYKKAIKLIEKAKEEERSEIFYRLWLARYPNYTKDNFETFEEFYDKCVPKKIEYDTRSKDDIMDEILGKNNIVI